MAETRGSERSRKNTSFEETSCCFFPFLRSRGWTNQATPRNHVSPSKEPSRRTTDSREPPRPSPSEFSYEEISSFEAKVQQILGAMRRNPPRPLKVGIFSRSAESEYEWLKKRLESQSIVRSVRPCYISNNSFREFSDNVSWCNFGILYHTQNRGRINLTDVTDALYDEEIQELSRRLEKKNVVVVIDDLTDSSEERKRQILQDQPKLKALAAEVILVSADEKK